jgi:hypothetical protein
MSWRSQGKAAIRKRSQEASCGKSVETILSTSRDGKSRTIRRGTETGAWLSVPPSTVSGTELSAQEFRDALSMRCGVRCDGCDAPFTLQHALACKKGGLVIFRHNESRDELVNLAAGKALTHSAARDEPLIKPSHVKEKEKDAPITDTSQKKTEQTAAGEDDRGDLLVRGFWAKGTDCMLDVRVTDTDAKSHSKRDPAKEPESVAREGEETKVFGGMPRKTSSLHPFCLLSGWHARTRGQNLRPTSGCQARQQMGKVLFTSLWMRQCSTEHSHCSRHAPVQERKPSPRAQNQHPLSPMGRRSWHITV